MRHPEAARGNDEGGFGLADVPRVVPEGDDAGVLCRRDGGHQVGGMLPDAGRHEPGGGIGEHDGTPAVGALGLDVGSELEAHGRGEGGRSAVEDAELAAALEESRSAP